MKRSEVKMNSKSFTTVSRLFSTGGILLLVIGLMLSLVSQTARADGGPIGLGGGGDVVEPVNPSEPAPPSASDNNPAPGTGIQSFNPSQSDPSSKAAPAQRKSYPRAITPQSRAGANINPAIPIQVFNPGLRLNNAILEVRFGCESSTGCGIKAIVCQAGDEISEPGSYDLYYTPDMTADPLVIGTRISGGEIPPLFPGGCYDINSPVTEAGNYRYVVHQPANNQGSSDAIGPICTFIACRASTATPTVTPTNSVTPTSTNTNTPTPTDTNTSTPTATATTTATATATVTATATATQTGTQTTSTATATTSVTATSTVTATQPITPPPPPGEDPTRTPTPTQPVNLTPAKSPTPGGGPIIPPTGTNQPNPASLESLMMYVGLLFLGLGLVTAGINKRLFNTNR
jgi:hypothetical protein